MPQWFIPLAALWNYHFRHDRMAISITALFPSHLCFIDAGLLVYFGPMVWHWLLSNHRLALENQGDLGVRRQT